MVQLMLVRESVSVWASGLSTYTSLSSAYVKPCMCQRGMKVERQGKANKSTTFGLCLLTHLWWYPPLLSLCVVGSPFLRSCARLSLSVVDVCITDVCRSSASKKAKLDLPPPPSDATSSPQFFSTLTRYHCITVCWHQGTLCLFILYYKPKNYAVL